MKYTPFENIRQTLSKCSEWNLFFFCSFKLEFIIQITISYTSICFIYEFKFVFFGSFFPPHNKIQLDEIRRIGRCVHFWLGSSSNTNRNTSANEPLVILTKAYFERTFVVVMLLLHGTQLPFPRTSENHTRLKRSSSHKIG